MHAHFGQEIFNILIKNPLPSAFMCVLNSLFYIPKKILTYFGQ